MQIYRVGGAVRDKLLEKKSNDNDYVVINSSEEEMQALGYKKVGKAFPVFLHPKTGEEYALARKEIKTGSGHCDFEFIFTPDITLKEDSFRRDFTCNALYQDLKTGEIIDYHNGIDDIKNHLLRHVSPHFQEDPLRVLRMCRFAATLNFKVAPETMTLCQKMVKEGALSHLSSNRLWQEFEKALSSPNFFRFIETARECGALKAWLPEVEALFAIPERLDYHPEANSGAHTLLALKAAQSTDSLINFTVLFHDIGKIKTNPAFWPSHHGHDRLGAELIKQIGQRVKFPKEYVAFASFTIARHMLYHQPLNNIKDKLAEIAVSLAHHQKKEYVAKFLSVLNADMLGRKRVISQKDIKEFENFALYLQKLIAMAKEHKISELPEFPRLMEALKQNKLSPSDLNEAFQNFILEKVSL
ncbi:MAG: HD domain-containing protein [Alphaproteobacteria bacterium]|nr:HD domain-containing protein [Alphaproteobacteria bacterium]